MNPDKLDTAVTLLPCPFCGNHQVAQGSSRDYISVWCDCGARGPEVPFPEHCDPLPPILECHEAWNRRAASLPSTGAGMVRGLVWETPDDRGKLSRAETILGPYRTWTHHEANGRWFWSCAHDNGEVASEAEAKAAAQADYESRIRSALVATPPSPKLGVANAVHAAALAWCGEKERETFPEDIEYFKQNWRSLPGLTAYVHRELGREALSQLEKARGVRW